jgi:hypothetical protein
MAVDLKALVALVDDVPLQAEVCSADLAAAEEQEKENAREAAIDGVAHHVFNTLRGADDLIMPGEYTFAQVREIVARSF